MTWPPSQGGLRAVINAAGRLVERGVLPGLRRLTVEGVVPGGMSLPRPDAAPQVTPQTSPPKDWLGVWHPAVCPPSFLQCKSKVFCHPGAFDNAVLSKACCVGQVLQIMLTCFYSYASKLSLQVDTRLLPQSRRLPGQVFCITDDILPDMRLALGLPEDWQRHFNILFSRR